MKVIRPPLIVSLVFYIVGAILGFTLVLLATWADVEAQTYGFYRRANLPLPGLDCPILMRRGEESQITLRITNTTDKPLGPNVRMEISTPALSSTSTQFVKLAPGESKTLAWTVGPENIELGYFIFASALTYSAYPMPERQSICGIFIVNLPATGGTIVATMIVLSLLGMGIGLIGLYQSPSPSRRVAVTKNPLLVLSALIAFSILITFLGWWLQAVLLLVLIFLLAIIVLGLLIKAE